MFTYIDVIILVVLAILVIVGLVRGFVGSIIKLFGRLVRLVLSISLAKPLAKLLTNITKIDERLFDIFKNKAVGMSDSFSVNLVGLNETELNSFVDTALNDASIPKIFRGLFKNVFSISPETIATHESITLADLIGATISNIILLLASFALLYILFWIMLIVIKKLTNKALGSSVILARTNRVLGAVVGLLQTLFIVFIAFSIISFVSNMGLLPGFVATIKSSIIAGPLYNATNYLIYNAFNLKELLERWITKTNAVITIK